MASRQPQIDAWLRNSGRVVAATERAARAIAGEYHSARRREGLVAWPAPDITDWNGFVRDAWKAAAPCDERLVLNAAQEQMLWSEIISSSPAGRDLLPGPLEKMAAMAADAHGLLCSYAPQLLEKEARAIWTGDASSFSVWLAEFDRECGKRQMLSAARLPLELIGALEKEEGGRPQLLLVGFDRIQPAQGLVLEAWGPWRQSEMGEQRGASQFRAFADQRSELAACAAWCADELAKTPGAQLLVLTQDAATRRGQIERAFFSAGLRFEISLGVPLEQLAVIRSAHLLLRWLGGALAEHELEWLLGSGHAVANPAETNALTGFMRAIRRCGRERTHWGCEEFLSQRPGVALPAEWEMRIRHAKRQFDAVAGLRQLPLAWAEVVPDLLQSAGWPHPEGSRRALTSEEFQALRRWQRLLDTCASLGFDGRRMRWNDFLAVLGRELSSTLFAPESRQEPVVIAGPMESAGLSADAIWMLGVSEEAWPGKGSLHPLIPVGVQRDFRMPHATPQLDWDLARTATLRLLGSAPEVNFSCARQVDGVEMRPSRLVVQNAGEPEPMAGEAAGTAGAAALVEAFVEASLIPLAAERVAGGAEVLSAQSQCPFKAFAAVRLGAVGWERAQAGLTAAQRGTLLHAVLHAVWGQGGMRSHAQLIAVADLRAFVAQRVRAVLADSPILAAVRERMPKAYLALEEERLTNVVTEWLAFERTRAEFTVVETEVKKEGRVAGLALDLRLDRVDRLKDSTLLVIDYKSGDVNTAAWNLPRPEDVQLPLYAGFALDRDGAPLGGLVFAKIRAGKSEFAGRVWDARETLLPNGIEKKDLAKKKLTLDELEAWRGCIEQLARDFVAGHAEVDPIDRRRTCKNCQLPALCRIAESGVLSDEDEGGETADD